MKDSSIAIVVFVVILCGVLATLGIITIQNAILFNTQNGLVGYWSLNEAQGTKVYDYSGSGSTVGTVSAGTSWIQGNFGSAISFTAINSQFIDIPNDPNLPTGGASGSCFAWIDPTTVNTFMPTCSYGTAGAHNNRIMYVDNNAHPYFEDGTCGVSATTLTVSASSWQLLGYTFASGSNTVILWLGTSSQSLTCSPNTVGTHLQIATNAFAGGSSYFNGAIDDVRFYNYALSATQEGQLAAWIPGV